MSSSPTIPDFAQLLGPYIAAIPEPSRPALLCRLERFAADRYREWADECPGEERESLLACATREDEIADRVVALFPASASDEEKIEAEVSRAGESYAAIFDDLSLSEKYFVQASAERQGAAAWRGLAGRQQDKAIAADLAICADLEETSAACLERLLELDEGATQLK